jgi:hypothetical protein
MPQQGRVVQFTREGGLEVVRMLLGVVMGLSVTGPALHLQGGDLRHALAADDDDEFRWDCRGREVAIDIARGLHFLHSAGVVHRCSLRPGSPPLCSSGAGCAQVPASLMLRLPSV